MKLFAVIYIYIYRELGGSRGARHRREINRSRQGETQGTFRVEKIFSVGRKVAEEFAFQSARGPGAACIREQQSLFARSPTDKSFRANFRFNKLLRLPHVQRLKRVLFLSTIFFFSFLFFFSLSLSTNHHRHTVVS